MLDPLCTTFLHNYLFCYPADFQLLAYTFANRVENSVDPDQMASTEACYNVFKKKKYLGSARQHQGLKNSAKNNFLSKLSSHWHSDQL